MNLRDNRSGMLSNVLFPALERVIDRQCVLGQSEDYQLMYLLVCLNSFQEVLRVLRNGQEVTIKATELRRGDILTLQPGDVVPSDVYITEVSAHTCAYHLFFQMHGMHAILYTGSPSSVKSQCVRSEVLFSVFTC